MISFRGGINLKDLYGSPAVLNAWGLEDEIKRLINKYGGVYWPLQESSGLIASAYASVPGAFDGSINGATIGQYVSPEIGNAYSFDGNNDSVNIYSADLVSLFNGQEITIFCFAEVSSGAVWLDAANRRFFQLKVDASNQINITKRSTNNEIAVDYNAGGVLDRTNISTSTEDLFMVGVTASLSLDEMKTYFNGSQYGLTRNTLGTWAGNLAANSTAIASDTAIGALVFSGLMSHFVILTGIATSDEFLNIAEYGGVA